MNENYSMSQVATNFMYRVYAWMATGLAISGLTAYFVSTTALVSLLQHNIAVLLVLFLIQIGLVVVLSLFLHSMSYFTASLAFILYAVASGMTLSLIFIVYTNESIAMTFFITAAMFAFLALYGYYTKTDLTSLGNILRMALFGLVIAMLANLYFRNSTASYIISGVGVLVFSGLTAFDVQQIKNLSYKLLNEGEMANRVSILGALTLYLDFINLFLMLLNFTGKRKD